MKTSTSSGQAVFGSGTVLMDETVLRLSRIAFGLGNWTPVKARSAEASEHDPWCDG
jgi:hypothetical protein